MNQSEWLASTDPEAMMEWATGPRQYAGYQRSGPPTISKRKLRLLAVACCRRIWHLLDDRSHLAVGVTERHVDGKATENELERACYSVRSNMLANDPRMLPGLLGNGGRTSELPKHIISFGAAYETPSVSRAAQADILRDIFNPWWDVPVKAPRRPVDRRRDSKWEGTPWLTEEAVGLAWAAYEGKAASECQFCHGKGYFQTSNSYAECPQCLGPNGTGTGKIMDGRLDDVRLMVLADHLEENGCPIEEDCDTCRGTGGRWYCKFCRGEWLGDVGDGCLNCDNGLPLTRIVCITCDGKKQLPNPLLAHLRSPGPHFLGMWSLDWCVSKE